MQYLFPFCSRPEATSYVILRTFLGLTVADKFVKLRDARFNLSREIRPKAAGCGIFGRFSNIDKCRPELAGVGVDVAAKNLSILS